MILFESEAMSRWCPFAQVGTVLHVPRPGLTPDRTVGASGNRGTTMRRPLDATYCIGSQCMAWRWMLNLREELSTNALGETDKKNIYIAADDPPRGFCGLAGHPNAWVKP